MFSEIMLLSSDPLMKYIVDASNIIYHIDKITGIFQRIIDFNT